MGRIKLSDTTTQAIIKMSEGNPGATVAIATIIKTPDAVPIQVSLSPMDIIIMLDAWEIYGSDIHALFKYKCKGRVHRLLMLITATYLGFFPELEIKKMAADHDSKINITDDKWQEISKKVHINYGHNYIVHYFNVRTFLLEGL